MSALTDAVKRLEAELTAAFGPPQRIGGPHFDSLDAARLEVRAALKQEQDDA